MTERTNYQRVNDLGHDGSTRLEAVRDLRDLLERGLYHWLNHVRNDLSDRSVAELRQIAQDYAREALFKILDNLALLQDASQFTTWAAKFAARVATADLKCDH